MGEIVQAIPVTLSRASAASASWKNSSIAFDFAIGGMPFLSGASDRYPMQRATAPVRKEQFDASSEPGEQSFAQWWLRSQASFHSGAGLKFLEPANDEIIMTQFASSVGVDPWEKGEVTLLPKVDLVQAGADANACLVGYSTVSGDRFLFSDGAAVYRHTGVTANAATWGGSGSVLSMTQDGTNAYIADSTGIYTMPLAAGSGALLWNTISSSVAIGWEKQRLMAGIGPSVYELADDTGAPTLPTAIYTHPNASWEWKSFTSGPGAIYAAGFAGNQGAIFSFQLDASGDAPDLNSAVVAAELPTGEIPYCIYGYLGAYMGIGTNKGLRVGIISTDGSVQFGPLIFETTDPVRSIVGKDRFLYATAAGMSDGDSGLVRVDLATEIEPLRYAYANDLAYETTANPSAVAPFGTSGRLVIAAEDALLESATELVPSGYIQTGKVRFNTFEDKLFKFVRGRIEAPQGTVAVATIAANGAETEIITLDSAVNLDADVTLSSPVGPQEFLSLKFTLARDADDTSAGPTLKGYQLKALPASDFGEILRVPVLMFDREMDRDHRKFGYTHSAWERFQALKDIEITGDTRRFQDLRVGTTVRVIIESTEFQEVTPPWGRSTGFGGVCYITMRTVP